MTTTISAGQYGFLSVSQAPNASPVIELFLADIEPVGTGPIDLVINPNVTQAFAQATINLLTAMLPSLPLSAP